MSPFYMPLLVLCADLAIHMYVVLYNTRKIYEIRWPSSALLYLQFSTRFLIVIELYFCFSIPFSIFIYLYSHFDFHQVVFPIRFSSTCISISIFDFCCVGVVQKWAGP